MRLNKKPIFVVAFARGGSNILLNLLRSHPEACSPRGETNEVFHHNSRSHMFGSYTNRILRNLNRYNYLPILALEGEDIFSFKNWEQRKPLKAITQGIIDRKLFYDKQKAVAPDQNMYKSDGIKYSREEIADARLVCKNLNGLIFMSQEFHRMFADAKFVCLVRNGYAVCEGHIRRGWDTETIARNYQKGCQQMIHDSKTIPDYHIFKYEDLMARPYETLSAIYEAAELDINKVSKVRLSDKLVMNKDGERTKVAGNGAVEKATRWTPLIWYDIHSFGKHFRPDANSNQIKQLSSGQKKIITDICSDSLTHFGYKLES